MLAPLIPLLAFLPLGVFRVRLPCPRSPNIRRRPAKNPPKLSLASPPPEGGRAGERQLPLHPQANSRRQAPALGCVRSP